MSLSVFRNNDRIFLSCS